jgi:hypothetical protein
MFRPWSIRCFGPGLAAGLLLGCGAPRARETKAANPPVTVKSSVSAQPVDNSYCYVCHVNYQEEPLARQHGAVGVGCEQCHGMSAKHSADEDNLTAPDKMYTATRVVPFCLSCHTKKKLALDPNHQPLLAKSVASPPRCTECHGEHRLKNRTRRWDKNTGILIWKDSGPVMDRKS